MSKNNRKEEEKLYLYFSQTHSKHRRNSPYSAAALSPSTKGRIQMDPEKPILYKTNDGQVVPVTFISKTDVLSSLRERFPDYQDVGHSNGTVLALRGGRLTSMGRDFAEVNGVKDDYSGLLSLCNSSLLHSPAPRQDSHESRAHAPAFEQQS